MTKDIWYWVWWRHMKYHLVVKATKYSTKFNFWKVRRT